MEEQLAERRSQKTLEAALRLQEEQETSTALAFDLKAEMEVRVCPRGCPRLTVNR